MRTFSGVDLAGCRFPRLQFGSGPTRDYYALAGIFFSTHILPNVGPKTNGPPMLRVPLETPTEQQRRADREKRLKAAERELTAARAAVREELVRRLREELPAHLLAV